MTDSGLIREVVRPHRGDIVTGTVLAVLHQCCEALVAVLIGVIVDQAITTGDTGRMAVWVGALVAVFVVLALAAMVGYYRLTRAEQTIAHELRVRLATCVVDACAGTDALARPGEVLSLASSDAGRVGSVAQALGVALSRAAVLVAGAAYLLVTSWRLGVVVLAGLPVLVWFSQRAATPLLARSSAEQAAIARAAGLWTVSPNE